MARITIVTDEPTQHTPTDEPVSRVASVFARQAVDARVMVAHGYGVSVKVWNGQLEVCDGIGRHRRTRKVPKADRQTVRLVITGTEGYITLAALRWCREHGVSVTMLDRDGDLVAAKVPEPGNSVSLLRKQALAGPDGPLADFGIEISKYLINLKLRGQSVNLVKLLSQHRAASRIDHYAGMLADATTYDEINELERWAANTYFTAWRGNVVIPWPARELEAIPPGWLAYERRKASTVNVNSSKRYACDPVNAMLNYAYGVGYAESRIACIANQLNPLLGFIHSDNDRRDSLALDILEAVRPDIDAFILGLLGYGSEPRTFTRKDFTEPRDYPHGTVRLVAPLTHEIAEQSLILQERLNEVACDVAGILGAQSGKHGRRSHNLAAQKAEFVSKAVDVDSILPVSVWESFRGMLPPEKAHPKGGFSPISNRNTVAALIYLEHHHKPLAAVPLGFNVSPRTIRSRRQEWKRLGIWESVQSIVLDLATRPMN